MGRKLKDPEKIAARIDEKIKPANKAMLGNLKMGVQKTKAASQAESMRMSSALSTAAGGQDNIRGVLNDAFRDEAKRRIKEKKAAESEARKKKK